MDNQIPVQFSHLVTLPAETTERLLQRITKIEEYTTINTGEIDTDSSIVLYNNMPTIAEMQKYSDKLKNWSNNCLLNLIKKRHH